MVWYQYIAFWGNKQFMLNTSVIKIMNFLDLKCYQLISLNDLIERKSNLCFTPEFLKHMRRPRFLQLTILVTDMQY